MSGPGGVEFARLMGDESPEFQKLMGELNVVEVGGGAGAREGVGRGWGGVGEAAFTHGC